MTRYDAVFSPLSIGRLTIPNRLVRTAHGIRAPWLDTSDRLLRYHAARAEGGAALSFLGAAGVLPWVPSGIPLSEDRVVDGYRRLAEAVHAHGSFMMQQLWHPGSSSAGSSGEVPWSASAVPNPLSRTVPQPMTRGMIDEVVGGFAAAATRVADGGLDGVEIHAASGYLLEQFLSPLTNLRTDDYGGPLVNRARLLLESIRAVRAAVGPDFPVGVRLVLDEGVEGGIDAAMSRDIAELLAPEIDFLDLHMGSYYRYYRMLAPGDAAPLGYELADAERVTASIGVPTIVAGRIMTLDMADHVVRSGIADMVSVVRATIADPELPNKARRGAEERTRPCISTNEGCVGGVLEGSFGCVVNPEAGQEDLIPAVTPALRPAHVLVAGGGPAGLEAARVLASRGHRVSLFEMRRDLGGQVPIAASAPHRSDVAAIVSWLTDEITRLGVRIVRGTPVDPDLVRQLDPDAVIVATGSTPRRDGFTAGSPGRRVPGVHQPHVGTSWDLFGFGGRTVVGATAVVVDDTGTYEAVSVAEQLLAAGARTTLVTRHDSFGVNVPGQLATVLPARERLFAGDFELVSSSYLEEIGPATVTVRALAQGRARVLDAETVVLVGYNDPDRELAEALAESDYSGQIHVVGDASGTRTLREAIRDGSMVARRLEGPLMPRSTSTATGMPARQ